MFMNRILVAAALLLLVACGPSRHAVHVEMRYPSKSGIDFTGKNVSVVYMENVNPVSSGFAEGIADGLAYALEQDYGTGDGSIGIYKMNQKEGTDYSSKDSLIALLVDTDADVVFLLDTLAVGDITMGGPTRVASPVSKDSSYISTGSLPFTMTMYCMDAMNKDEKVYTFKGSSVAAPFVYSDGKQRNDTLVRRSVASLPEVGFETGKMISESFKSQWKHEQHSIVYFDGQKWYTALDYAERYLWKDAIDIWIGLLNTNDMLKRSCAEYNIAVACYMLGDYSLAKEWLDQSDKDNQLPLSDALHKRIDSHR